MPKNAYAKSKHDKVSDKPKLTDILQNKWLVIFKNVNVVRRKKDSEWFSSRLKSEQEVGQREGDRYLH